MKSDAVTTSYQVDLNLNVRLRLTIIYLWGDCTLGTFLYSTIQWFTIFLLIFDLIFCLYKSYDIWRHIWGNLQSFSWNQLVLLMSAGYGPSFCAFTFHCQSEKQTPSTCSLHFQKSEQFTLEVHSILKQINLILYCGKLYINQNIFKTKSYFGAQS